MLCVKAIELRLSACTNTKAIKQHLRRDYAQETGAIEGNVRVTSISNEAAEVAPWVLLSMRTGEVGR